MSTGIFHSHSHMEFTVYTANTEAGIHNKGGSRDSIYSMCQYGKHISF